MRVKHLSISLTAFFCVLSLSLSALPKNFEPFEPGKQPPQADVTVKEIAYDMRFSNPLIYKMTFNSPALRVLCLKYNRDDECTTVTIKGNNGKILMQPTQLADCCPCVVWMVDINNDGTPDFIIQKYSNGNGLCNAISTLYFILSVDDTYQYVQAFDHLFMAKNDFIKLSNGTNAFLFTRHFTANTGQNFFVYNLVAFNGTQMVSLNRVDSRFPCWLETNSSNAYDKPIFDCNHKDTNIFTGEQRVKLWRTPKPWVDSPTVKDGKSHKIKYLQELDFLAEDQKNVPKH